MTKWIATLLCWTLFFGCRPQPTSEPGPNQSSAAADPAVEEPAILPEDQLADGWVSLFDGRTLFGWQSSADLSVRVEDDAIAFDTTIEETLPTTFQVGDCVLQLDFRTRLGADGGVLLNWLPEATDPATDYYEVKLRNSEAGGPSGSLTSRQRATGAEEAATWRSLTVRLEDRRLTVSVGDKQVLDYEAPHAPGRGHIALRCDHGRIQIRNIRLKPLGLKPLFNGQDLTGWKPDPAMSNAFTVTENGELNVNNGRCQLESEEQFGDFVLQLECISHAPRLNSGLFFRCIPGEKMNGYESQIHNGYLDDDRTKPEDCGTGGIFRRQNARRVVADDLKWFSKTLIVDGPHVTVWVNGYQVTDWTDTRAPNPNPRSGLRLEPGTLMIQGHDPTTNLSFRNLRAAELPARGTAP